MGSMGYIAMIDRDGTGRYVYLGHACYPDKAGIILLEHYSEMDTIRELIDRGSISGLWPSIQETDFHHLKYDDNWERCKPLPLQNGTEEFFGRIYDRGPEWLYAWTPDGWFAAMCDRDPPESWRQMDRMTPAEYQDWLDNNQEQEWVAWRARARLNQRPRPLLQMIEKYRDWLGRLMALPLDEDLKWDWE